MNKIQESHNSLNEMAFEKYRSECKEKEITLEDGTKIVRKLIDYDRLKAFYDEE